jgi:AcrR family transcriptional regulator
LLLEDGATTLAEVSPADRDPPHARRRRMSPEDRRQQIIDAARHLFSERSLSEVSTADIADAAGVARSLVHHYFGGIREVFFAVVASTGAAMSENRDAGVETPFQERIAHNVAAGLDVVDRNRETWLAVVGHGNDSTDPQIHALLVALKERGVDRSLVANSDILRDTPTTRYALRCFQDFSMAATRAWIVGDKTREEAETLLVTAAQHLMRDVIPALEAELAQH